jgi:hypothetical protein
MENTVIRVVTPYNSKIFRRFGGTGRLYLQDLKVIQTRNQY